MVVEETVAMTGGVIARSVNVGAGPIRRGAVASKRYVPAAVPARALVEATPTSSVVLAAGDAEAVVPPSITRQLTVTSAMILPLVGSVAWTLSGRAAVPPASTNCSAPCTAVSRMGLLVGPVVSPEHAAAQRSACGRRLRSER
jgi:hypothetical protein